MVYTIIYLLGKIMFKQDMLLIRLIINNKFCSGDVNFEL